MIYDHQPRKIWHHRSVILLIIIAVAVVLAGISGYEDGRFDWRSLLGNLSTELIGGVITFLLIDRFISRYEDNTSTRNSLIGRLENRDNGLVQNAVLELRTRGWLQDGSLHGWFLHGSNFEGIYLGDAKVNGLGLYRCNLKDAGIKVEQLLQLNDLRFTIMPNGKIYDGRYCLKGDINWAKTHYDIDFMKVDADEMAKYYGVDTETFIIGQKWARENLPSLGYEIPPYLERLSGSWEE